MGASRVCPAVADKPVGAADAGRRPRLSCPTPSPTTRNDPPVRPPRPDSRRWCRRSARYRSMRSSTAWRSGTRTIHPGCAGGRSRSRPPTAPRDVELRRRDGRHRQSRGAAGGDAVATRIRSGRVPTLNVSVPCGMALHDPHSRQADNWGRPSYRRAPTRSSTAGGPAATTGRLAAGAAGAGRGAKPAVVDDGHRVAAARITPRTSRSRGRPRPPGR